MPVDNTRTSVASAPEDKTSIEKTHHVTQRTPVVRLNALQAFDGGDFVLLVEALSLVFERHLSARSKDHMSSKQTRNMVCQ